MGDLLLGGEKLLRGGGRIVHDVGVGVVKLLLGRGGVGVEEALLELGRHLPIQLFISGAGLVSLVLLVIVIIIEGSGDTSRGRFLASLELRVGLTAVSSMSSNVRPPAETGVVSRGTGSSLAKTSSVGSGSNKQNKTINIRSLNVLLYYMNRLSSSWK